MNPIVRAISAGVVRKNFPNFMDLHSEYPYSLLRKGILRSYPSLQSDLRTDITVIGAGVTGALVAYHLVEAGFEVTVIDKRHVGMGSTAASTGLLQYEIDVPLHKLIGKLGRAHAEACYVRCRDAIYEMDALVKKLHEPCGFDRRPSFQFASFRKDVKALQKEHLARTEVGIEVELLSQQDIRTVFGFSKHAGLLSQDGAVIDAYSFTHSLFSSIKEKVKIFDQTEIVDIRKSGKGFLLRTNTNRKVTTKKIVIACGYESSKYLPARPERFHSTYSIVSEPSQLKEPWHRNSLIWETSNPYLYLRTGDNGRMFIGGKDDKSSNAKKRDANLGRKAVQLEKAFRQLFPNLPFRTDFKWAGVFASTKDGLPYIGTIPERNGYYFALGYGGNGITFSLIAAQIIRDCLLGKHNSSETLFQFNR